MTGSVRDGERRWQRAEREINDALSVDATISSGNTPFDKGDGTTRNHPADDDRFQLQVDEKSTKHRSYSINLDYMEECVRRAAAEGKIFLLPVRFQPDIDTDDAYDYIVLRLDDFRFMLGFDQLRRYRRDAEESRENRRRFLSAVSKSLMALDSLCSAPNISPDQKNVIFKAIDAIDAAMGAA